ncbi:MAG TPA: hypothetical protein VF407_13355 [Polyangiaceae bacterium]
MSDVVSLLERLRSAFDAAQVPFMIAGSFASTAHGAPRTTQDLDVVIDPPDLASLDRLLTSFQADSYYVDTDAAHDAFRRRSMFNVIDMTSGWKVDLIIRKQRPFSMSEMNWRTELRVLGVVLLVATAEDTIVAKLEWSRESGGSERQRRDIAGILATNVGTLDRGYLEAWIDALDLRGEWNVVVASE